MDKRLILSIKQEKCMNVIRVKREGREWGEKVKGRKGERCARMVDLFLIKSRSRSLNWGFNI